MTKKDKCEICKDQDSIIFKGDKWLCAQCCIHELKRGQNGL